MDKAARNKVCLALRKKLKDPSGRCYVSKHPVLALWRSSDLAICKAIVECFAQYTNLPDRLDAEDLKQKGGIELIRISDELIKKHSDTVDTAFRELLMHIARSVESLGENPKKDALLELCLKVVLVRRIDQPNFSKKPPNLSKTILNNDKYCDLLVDFLDATDQIAIELNAEFQIKKLDEPLFLAGYIRVHLDGERRRNSLLNCTGKDFEYLQNIDVQELAQKACLLEFNFESQHGRKLPFPFSYLQPFALTPEDLTGVNIRSRHYIRFRPSYYAARLACAALMMSNSSEGDHECNRSLLRLFLLPHAEREKVYSPKQLPNLSGASGTAKSVFNYFGTENKKAGGKEATYLYSLSTEYDSASEWRLTLGRDGATAGAAQSLLKGTRGDAQFVVEVLNKLLEPKSEYRSTVPVALTGKFGAYFGIDGIRFRGEPTCKDGYKCLEDSATAQIDFIKEICYSLRRNNLAHRPNENVGGIVFETVDSIYYENWPHMRILRDDFDWKNGAPTNWNERTSDRHLEIDDAPKAHLWLYGKGFQESVDRAIGEVGTNRSKGNSHYFGDGDRFTRFTLLIPKCRKKASEKILDDFPGDAAMKRILHYLGRTESIKALNLRSDIYAPIVFRVPLLPENQMFKVGH